MTPAEFLNKNFNGPTKDVEKAMEDYARFKVIEELQKHIEHPMKPGYRRHDIINRIKELKG